MTTPLKSIRKKCRNCQEKTTDIIACEFKDCSLYNFRMGTGRPKLKDIRAYCKWCTLDSDKEIRLCPSKDCSLYKYRMSKNPKMQGRTNAGSFKSKKHGTQAVSEK